MSRSTKEYLRHILDEINYIENSVGDLSCNSFLADETLKLKKQLVQIMNELD